MKADEFLDAAGVEYEEVVQDEPTRSCDDAARARGVETAQIVKSLIIRSNGEKLHVLVPGDRELSEKKLGAEYRMVPPEEAEEITGFEPGTVHPFSTELYHLVDERVFERERLSHTVGEKKRGVIIDGESFREALESAGFEFEVEDLVVSNERDLEELDLERKGARFVVENGYRREFRQLSSDFEPGRVLEVLKEFDRHEIEVEVEKAQKILKRMESQTHMQKLVEELVETGEMPDEGDDDGFDLESVVEEAVEDNPEAADDYMNGKESALNHLLGQVMQETNGRADGNRARELLEEELDGSQ
ncbi:MAG: YbaK/EbsC family protein [Candidatus Nanohaloarchaea archaeon]